VSAMAISEARASTRVASSMSRAAMCTLISFGAARAIQRSRMGLGIVRASGQHQLDDSHVGRLDDKALQHDPGRRAVNGLRSRISRSPSVNTVATAAIRSLVSMGRVRRSLVVVLRSTAWRASRVAAYRPVTAHPSQPAPQRLAANSHTTL
jgi:hypothetical protein